MIYDLRVYSLIRGGGIGFSEQFTGTLAGLMHVFVRELSKRSWLSCMLCFDSRRASKSS